MNFITKPGIESFPISDHYKLPEGTKLDCITEPDQLAMAKSFPVVAWNSYTYWPLSYIDNREAMCIVVYGDQGTIVKTWEKSGARYIYKITIDEDTKTVTFWGQADKTIVMSWEELYLMTPPITGKISTEVHPKIPEGCKLDPSTGPNTEDLSKDCPIVQMNSYTYWPFDYIDNREAMNIVAYDIDGTMIKQWEQKGARYPYKVTSDKVKQTVIFWGQDNKTIEIKWSDLFLMKPPKLTAIPVDVKPEIPDGCKLDPATEPDKPQQSKECPVVQMDGYTYWPLDYMDNREAMNIVAYNKDGNIVKQWEQKGARYPYKITEDNVNQTITIWGQSNQTIVMKWQDLLVE